MGIFTVTIPQMGEGLQNVKIIELLKVPGNRIVEDEVIYCMETDKSIIEIESPVAGELIEWLVKQGDTVPIGNTIAKIKVSDFHDSKYQSLQNNKKTHLSNNTQLDINNCKVTSGQNELENI